MWFSIYTGKALDWKMEKAKYKSRQTAAHPSNWLVVSKLQKIILGIICLTVPQLIGFIWFFLLDNITNKLLMILISRVCDNQSYTIPKPEMFEVTENESLRLLRVQPLIHSERQDS